MKYRVEFLEVYGENIFSFKLVLFKILLSGITFIKGINNRDKTVKSNGSGKSSFIVNILCWTLFGKTPDGKGLDSAINTQIKKNCLGQVLLKFNKTTYKIQRYRKHKKFKNKLLIYKQVDNEFIPIDTLEPQQLIEQILDDNYKSFCMRVIFGASSLKLTEHSTTSDLKSIFKKFTNIEQYEKAHDYCKLYLQKLRIQLEDNNKEMSNIEQAITYNTNQIELSKTQHAQLIKRQEEESDWITQQIYKKEIELQEIKIESSQQLQIQIDNLKQQLIYQKAPILQEMNAIKDESLAKDNEEIIIKTKIRQYEAIMDSCNKKIDKARKLNSTTCPTCDQPVSNQHTEKIIDMYLSDFYDAQERNLALKVDLGMIEDEKSLLRLKADSLNGNLKEVESTIRDAISLLHTKRAIIESRNQQKRSIDNDINNLKNKLSRNSQDKPILDTNKYYLKIQDYSSQILQLRSLIRRIEQEIKYYEYWKHAFSLSGIQNMVLSSITAPLNQTAKYYANKLSNGLLKINFTTVKQLKTTTKEQFNIEVSYDLNESYEQCSGGERVKANITIALSLAKIQTKYNFIIFDEIFEGADSDSIDIIIKLLYELSNERNIFLISHLEKLSNHFPNEITIIKNKRGFSEVK